MKLLYIANNRLPTEKAHGLQIVKTCEALLEQGVNVHLLSPRRCQPVGLKGKTIKAYYRLGRDLPHSRILCLDFLLLRSKLRAPNFLGVVAFWLQSLTFYTAAFVVACVKRGTIYSRDIGAVLPWALVGRRTFFEAHDFPKTRLGKVLRGIVVKRVTGLVVISHGLAERYEKEWKIPSHKIHIAPDGVDLAAFSLRSKSEARKGLSAFGDEKTYVVYAGNLYAWKGVYTLVEAVGILAQENVAAVIVGGDKHDGAYEALNRTLREKGITNVKLTGHLPPEEIPRILAAADILALPNSGKDPASAQYTSPLKMFEYMASGRPIVASDVPAIREGLNEESAFLCEPDNPEAWARAIRRVMTQKEEAERKARRALQEVERYSWNRRAADLKNFLAQKHF